MQRRGNRKICITALVIGICLMIFSWADSAHADWAFASMNPYRSEDDTLANGATGVAFWLYKAPGNDTMVTLGSRHSNHVNVRLTPPFGANCAGGQPSFHYGFIVESWDPGSGYPSIQGFLCDGTVAHGSTTNYNIKLPRGDFNSRVWFYVVQNGQDTSGKWKWDYSVYSAPEAKWYFVTTVLIDSQYIDKSPNMNAEIAAVGPDPCNDTFTPVTFDRVHVLKDGGWKDIPYLQVGYTGEAPPFHDCPSMDWDIIDSTWATATTNGRTSQNGTQWNGPDLIETAVGGPTSARRGRRITISDTVQNQGVANTISGFSVGFYLSLDSNNNISPSDILLTTSRTVSSLAESTGSSGSATVTIPTSVVPGRYYLKASADYNNQIPEGSETNNVKAGNAITIK